MKNNNISRLITTAKELLGSFGLFSNVTLLVFLKYMMESPEKIGNGVIDYKNIYEFRKAFDLTRAGKKTLSSQDFELLLDSVGFVGKATTTAFFFHDLSFEYERLFSGSKTQLVLANAVNDFELPDNPDSMKQFFETVLAFSYGDVRRTGEHITNKSLRTLVSKILNVQNHDSYMDCFCGYSSMLLSINEYEVYYGFDVDYTSFYVSVMMELLLGKRTSNVVCGDFLGYPTEGMATKLFSDAPIGFKISPSASVMPEYYDISKDLSITAFYKALDSLCEEGVGVFTVPAKTLTSVSKSYCDLRKKLAESGLKAVIELPPMWAGTNIQTNLLVVQKGYTGKITFVSAADAAVKTKDRSVTMLSDESIDKILNSINGGANIENYSVNVDRRDVICANTFALSKYMTPQSTIVEYRSVEDIDEELNELYARLHKNLNK